MASIYIVDDDQEIRDSLQYYLELEGHDISTFPSGEEAFPMVLNDPPNIILLDLQLPGMNGLEFFEKIRGKLADVDVIMITGHSDVTSAVKAMKLGAWDYVRKPFDPDEINMIVQKVVESRKKDEQLAYLQHDEKQHVLGDMVGVSKPMQEVFRFTRQVANSPKTSVLITGETGTGKELIAKYIHYNGPRANNPFIEVNCSAFQETLLESELFGHEAGAFTGARHRKKGLIELADEGTFFLDEIGDMSLELQAKILKVIEEHIFRRVGGTKEINIDIRVISASSHDLVKSVANHTFRKELFYRLNVASIELPPLRKRGHDILLLAEHFLKLYNWELNRNIKTLNPEVKSVLLKHSWPGNVRELRNVMERAVLFEKGNTLSLDSINFLNVPKTIQLEPPVNGDGFPDFDIPPDGVSLSEVEKSLIKKALIQTGGNKTRAAKLLGISREKLRYRIKKLDLPV